MQGVGPDRSPSFATDGAFIFCWGTTDLEDPATTMPIFGPYAEFSAESLTATTSPALSGATAKSVSIQKTEGNTITTTTESEAPPATTTAKQGETVLGTDPGQLPSGMDYGCKAMTIDPGVYVIRIVAAPWTSWAITVTPT